MHLHFFKVSAVPEIRSVARCGVVCVLEDSLLKSLLEPVLHGVALSNG